MSQIRCFYEKDPGFPATDQHPDAKRFAISAGIFTLADAIGGEPTADEITAAIVLSQNPAPPPPTKDIADMKTQMEAIQKRIDKIDAVKP